MLLNLSLLKHHWVLGGSGRGKTHKALLLIAYSLALLKSHTIIVIDMKKDEALVRLLKRIAKAAGLPFRVVTTDPRERSYVYNPLDQEARRHMTHRERSEMLRGSAKTSENRRKTGRNRGFGRASNTTPLGHKWEVQV